MSDKFLNGAGLNELRNWVNNKLTTKQDTLVSGTNIKTINGNSVLGSGNISISSGLQNLVDGSATGSVRGIGTKTEDSSYTMGQYAFAEGKNTKAAGIRAHAEGEETTASGDYSHTEGYYTTASGVYSHAEGFGAKASGGASHAEGYYTTANDTDSHAEGSNTTASGGASHAEGYYATASGNYSHAEGFRTKAIGISSHAEGSQTTASDAQSHAEGSNTTASGGASHAEGDSTTASGYASHAQNEDTIAGYRAQTAIGKYNDNQSDNLFEIGNGTDDNNRSNAFAVDEDGNAWASGDITDGNGNVLSNMVAKSILLDFCHPVGTYYYTDDADFNPNDSWGGTWSLLGEGVVLMSGTANGTYKVGTRYGANYKKIENANIAHGHGFTQPKIPNHKHDIPGNWSSGSGSTAAYMTSANRSATTRTTSTDGGGGSCTGGAVSNLYGAESSRTNFNVMQASQAVYIWHRTA